MDDYFLALVRELAYGGHSQEVIADILNDRELFRLDGTPWHQVSISRYMSAHGIKPANIFRGQYHSSTNNKKKAGPSDEQEKARLL